MVSELTGYLMILGDNGKVLVLDNEGGFVTALFKEGINFTCVASSHDKLLVGTDRGTIAVYHMASLEYITEVPFQLNKLQNFSLNAPV